MTSSRERGDMSKSSPMREGMPLKYHMWETGAASSICPILSRRTLARVTSTPQRSQTMPLYLTRLYLPQLHSQSLVGPKIFSQHRPSRSGLSVLDLIVSGFFTSPKDQERIFSDEAKPIFIYWNLLTSINELSSLKFYQAQSSFSYIFSFSSSVLTQVNLIGCFILFGVSHFNLFIVLI